MTHLVSAPDYAFVLTREVAFSETDAAGYLHFSSFMKYVEDTEHAVLRSLGIPVFTQDDRWPRVHIDMDFFAPMTFGTKVEICMWMEKIGNSSLTWNFHVRHAHCGTLSASGQLVCVRLDASGQKKLITSKEKAVLSSLM